MKNTIIYTTLSIFSFVFLLVCSDAFTQHPKQALEKLDCNLCHSCPNPTEQEPCLITVCPRPIQSATSPVSESPDVVILDELENLYVPVRFNHKLHAKMAGMADGCQMCHHYQDISKELSSCKSCHPTDIIHENLAQPGLKGAYHRQCLGCHTQWDKETACEICHEKKAGGGLHGTATSFAVHTKHEPIEMKELITFETEYDENDKVPFHHRLHAQQYERNCSVCHIEERCSACHVHREDSHPMGDLDEIDLHETCFQCHEEDSCEHCHGRDPKDLFTHKSTGWPLKSYHDDLYCRNCHAQRGAYMKLDNDCKSCHQEGWDSEEFDHNITGVPLDELHQQASCGDCHQEGIGKPATCNACHVDDRTYSKEQGFGTKESSEG